MTNVVRDRTSFSPTGAQPGALFQLDVEGRVNSTGLSVNGSPLSMTDVGDVVLVDIDFSTLANNSFADGAETIAGVNWTAANAATANTWDILNGTGLRFNAALSNTAYDSASRTAANLAVPILSLMPAFDPLRTYVIDMYLSSVTFGTSGNRIFAGLLLDTAGTDRLLGGGRRNSGGTQQTYGQADASLNGDTATDDAIGVRLAANGVSCFSGTMGVSFPTYIHGGGVIPLPSSFNGPFDPTQGQVVLAWPTGEAGGAMDCTLRRLRIRRIT